MATYAILGATGQTGSHILHLLLRNHPTAEINVLVRSRAKLEALLPLPPPPADGEDTTTTTTTSSLSSLTRLHVYEGTITDVPVVTACLRGVETVFLTVATLYNVPRTRVARDQAEAVVAALEALRRERQQQQQQQQQYEHGKRGGDSITSTSTGVNYSHTEENMVSQKGAVDLPPSFSSEERPSTATIKEKTNNNGNKTPLLVMLSSAETQTDPFCLDIPFPIRTFLFYCNYWIYTDLIAAEAYLRRRGDCVDTVFFKPGGIAHDIQRGHVLSTEKSQTFVSFWDVAAAMIECGSEDQRPAIAGKSVSVLSKGKANLPLETPLVLLKNLTGYLFPRLYEWLF